MAIGKLPWKASFVDMLLNYQIYKDWDKVAEIVNDREGVGYLSEYIERWIAMGYAPERYNFSIKSGKISKNHEVVGKFVQSLRPGMTDLEVHNLVYDTAKAQGVDANSLFASIYLAIIGKEKGPRMGKLLCAIGIEKVRQMLEFSIS